jgi:hypothetical protein
MIMRALTKVVGHKLVDTAYLSLDSCGSNILLFTGGEYT